MFNFLPTGLININSVILQAGIWEGVIEGRQIRDKKWQITFENFQVSMIMLLN